MEPSSWYELVAAVACLLLVSLTAATEAVLARITSQQLRKGLEVNGRAARSVEQLIARPHAYGGSMTLLRTIGAVALVTLNRLDLPPRKVSPAASGSPVGISAVLLLIVGHSLPRGLARRSVEDAANGLAGFAVLATALASPLVLIYDVVTRAFLFFARRPRTPLALRADR